MTLSACAELPKAARRHYPWQGARLQLSCGHAMHYVDEGAGDPVLFVHGNPTWSFYWRTLIAGLSGTARCVAPDHIGAGLSDKPQKWSYTLADHIDNLVEFIDLLELDRITLAVHDWGGAIGFGAALKRPDKIAKLAVFNTAVFTGPVPLSIRVCRWPIVGEALVQGLNGFIRGAMFRSLSDRSRLGNGVATGYLAPYRDFGSRVGHLAFVRDIPLEEGHPTMSTIEPMAAAVAATFADRPACLFWAGRDFVFTNSFLKRWQTILPQATVHTYPDASHWIVEDAHEDILPKLQALLAEPADK